MTTNGSEVAPLIGPLWLRVDLFLDHLHANGYAPQSVTNKGSIAIAFARWSQGERIAVEDLSEDHLAAFVKRRPPRPNAVVELRALRQFLTHLRVERGLPILAAGKPTSPADDLTQRYVGYLRTDRGLAQNSVLVYTPCVRDFLAYRLAKTGSLGFETLEAETIRAFLIERIAHRSSESARLLSVALRSLLRFLFLRGETPRDLSPAVPMGLGDRLLNLEIC